MKIIAVFLSITGLLIEIINRYLIESLGFFTIKTLGIIGILWVLLPIDVMRNKLSRAKVYVYILVFIKLLGLFVLFQNFGDTELLVILKVQLIQIICVSYLFQLITCAVIYLLIVKLHSKI